MSFVNISSYHMWILRKKLSEFRTFFTHDSYKRKLLRRSFIKLSGMRLGLE
jgi:hypothetical protein